MRQLAKITSFVISLSMSVNVFALKQSICDQAKRIADQSDATHTCGASYECNLEDPAKPLGCWVGDPQHPGGYFTIEKDNTLSAFCLTKPRTNPPALHQKIKCDDVITYGKKGIYLKNCNGHLKFGNC